MDSAHTPGVGVHALVAFAFFEDPWRTQPNCDKRSHKTYCVRHLVSPSCTTKVTASCGGNTFKIVMCWYRSTRWKRQAWYKELGLTSHARPHCRPLLDKRRSVWTTSRPPILACLNPSALP